MPCCPMSKPSGKEIAGSRIAVELRLAVSVRRGGAPRGAPSLAAPSLLKRRFGQTLVRERVSKLEKLVHRHAPSQA
jgi:hypothetical protein